MKLSDQKQRYSAMNQAKKTFVDIFLNVVYIHALQGQPCVTAQRDVKATNTLNQIKPEQPARTVTRNGCSGFLFGFIKRKKASET
jgi:hypothetical protein